MMSWPGIVSATTICKGCDYDTGSTGADVKSAALEVGTLTTCVGVPDIKRVVQQRRVDVHTQTH